MSEYVKFATSAADQYLSAVAEAQDSFLKSMTPFQQMASMSPKMPASSFMPELPTLAEIAEANFEFANKFLKQQKKFTEKFFAATTPPAES
jgi:hypothetical protein